MKINILLCIFLIKISLQNEISDCLDNCDKQVEDKCLNKGPPPTYYDPSYNIGIENCRMSVKRECQSICENNICLNNRYALGIGQNCKCNVDCISEECYDGICCRKHGAGTNNLNECCSKDGYHIPISQGANYNCY